MGRDDVTVSMDDELERRLAAYADARLALRPGASSRMRASVLIQARPLPIAPLTATAPVALAPRRRWRPLVALLAAAVAVLLLAGGALALSGPGRPLYGPRLWIESLTLPADPTARAAALEQRLEARLDEARAAAQAGDPGAVADALAAYREELAELVASGGTIGLAERLQTHVVALEALLGQVPTQARDAIERAIERSTSAIEQIDERNGGGGGSGGGGQGGGQGGGASPSHGPDKPVASPSDHGKPSPKPEPSPKAEPSPKPEPSPKAEPSPAAPPSKGSGAPAGPSPTN